MCSLAERDFDQFSGPFLEKYFRDKLSLTNLYSQIGRYWNKRNENELDIVAVNEWEKKALIAEVKRNPQKINLNQLRYKASEVTAGLQGYEISFAGFSLNEM